ncbi:Uncharacterised protein [Niallia circulans]|nr:Uncharacterised protein [Niallia circulans]
MLPAIDIGMPKPMTSPKLIANAVTPNSFRDMRPSKFSGTIGRNPSLKTAIPKLAITALSAPIAMSKITSTMVSLR